jgi:hypothetical protein
MKQYLVVALAALSIHASSRADVMYSWTSHTGTTPVNVSMTLVFSDDAVAAGALTYHLDPQTSSAQQPLAGLKSFSFDAGRLNPMSYDPSAGPFARGTGYLDLNLQFDPAGYLTGRIYANDQNSDFTVSSNAAGLFTFSAMHSDQDLIGQYSCDNKPGCTWSSGAMQRMAFAQADVNLGQVPEPGSLALIGLGLLGLGRAVKRRK